MKTNRLISTHAVLVFGDILILGIVTLSGFATHQTLDSAGAYMLTTLLPLTAAWFLISPHLKTYDLSSVNEPRELWRPFWSMWLAAPIMGLLRALWLDSVVIPIFVLVIGGVGSLAILAWRTLFLVVFARKERQHG
jgi:hypothetical protein